MVRCIFATTKMEKVFKKLSMPAMLEKKFLTKTTR